MKRLVLVLLFSLVSVTSAFSQQAEKIDEFSSYNCETMMARLDSFIVSLMKDPLSLGFVVVYEGKYTYYMYDRRGNPVYDQQGQIKTRSVLPTFAESTYRMRALQTYTFINRGLPKNRALFVDGGYQENHKVEFWIVPKGAKIPEILPSPGREKYRKGKRTDFSCGMG